MNTLKLTKLIRSRWLTPTLLVFTCPIIQCQKVDESSGGTCAVVLQNERNLAFAVDSAVTIKSMNGRRVESAPPACKMWLAGPSIVAVTTGLLNASRSFPGWNANDTGRAWLGSLPSAPTAQQIDDAMRGWGRQLISYLTDRPGLIQPGEGEIGTFLVAFRLGGKSYVYRERIVRHEGKALRDDRDSDRDTLSDQGGGRVYAGSCRNFINVKGGGSVPLTAAEMSELKALDDENRTHVLSAKKLGRLAIRYEQFMMKTSKNHASDPNAGDDIGPPFQLAILPAHSNKWITTFKSPCH